MSLAASLPAEMLLVIFEHLFFTKDLLCAALVNRAWRAACLSLKSVWRRHWKFLKHNDAHRRRVLARNEDEVDWFAETSAGVRREAAWQTGKFTTRVIALPSNFRKLNSVDDNTAIIQTMRPARPDEPMNMWGEKDEKVDVFTLVDIDTMDPIRAFPRTPGEFPDALYINGLGHVFCIPDYSSLRTFYYVLEDAYEWLGRPQPNLEDSNTWPDMDGFVFLGSQHIQSEGIVELRVDGAHTSYPKLTIHEQDTDNLSWIRWGPWNGQQRMMESGNEDFCEHSLTDKYVIIRSYDAEIIICHRDSHKTCCYQALKKPCAHYSFSGQKQSGVNMALDDLINEIQTVDPVSEIVIVEKAKPVSAKVEKLLCGDEFVSCSDVTPLGKHLFCTVGNGVVVFPDFEGPFVGRSKRAPLIVDLGGLSISIKACNDRLVLVTSAAFYIIDTAQFDGGAPPATLEAVTITRYGIIKGWAYGHRTNSKAKGATSQVTVTPRAIYETLKINPEWWDEKGEKMKERKEEKMPIKNFVRIYDFE